MRFFPPSGRKGRERVKKRGMKYIGIVIAAVILMIGCATNKQEKKTEKSTISIPQTLIYCTWEDEKVYTEKLVDSFMAEHPDITVEVQYISDEMTKSRAAKLLEDSEIDVIGLKNINDVLYLEEQGKIVDITNRIASSGIDVAYYGNMYGDISLEGKYWCLPTRKTSWVLVYNREIFKREGLKEPGQMTWEEFARTAKKLTREEEGEKQWGCYFVNWVYNFIGLQKKNYLYDDALPYVRKSLDFFNRIYFTEQSSMTPKEMDKENWLKTFERGNVAMMPMGEWFVGMIMADEKMGVSEVDWDIAPMPVPKGQKEGTTWGTYQFVSVSKTCEEKGRADAAFEFMKFLCGEDGAQIYAANGMIPAYVNQEIEEIYRDAVGRHNVDVFFDAYQVQESPVYDGYETLEEILEEEAVKFLNREENVNTVMQNFENRRRQFLEQRR